MRMRRDGPGASAAERPSAPERAQWSEVEEARVLAQLQARPQAQFVITAEEVTTTEEDVKSKTLAPAAEPRKRNPRNISEAGLRNPAFLFP